MVHDILGMEDKKKKKKKEKRQNDKKTKRQKKCKKTKKESSIYCDARAVVHSWDVLLFVWLVFVLFVNAGNISGGP